MAAVEQRKYYLNKFNAYHLVLVVPKIAPKVPFPSSCCRCTYLYIPIGKRYLRACQGRWDVYWEYLDLDHCGAGDGCVVEFAVVHFAV